MKNLPQLVLLAAALTVAGCETPKSALQPTVSESAQPTSNGLEAVSNTLPPAPAGTYDISKVTKIPSVRFQPAPRYPKELRKKGITGSAVVVFTVGTDGLVHDVFVLKTNHAALGEAAAEAVSKWKFRPASVDGRDVNCRMMVPVGFALTEDREE